MNKKHQMDPVFLLGAGRSGTKFLRDILGSSEDIAIIPYDIGYVWRYGNDSYPHDEFTPDMLDSRIKKFIKKTLPKLVANSSNTNAHMFIEKSVPNTLRPAFLHALYPNAKFIHLIRDGRAVTESSLRLWQAPSKKSYLLKKLRYFPLENYRYATRHLANRIKNKLSKKSTIQSWGPRYKGIDEDIKNLPLEIICAKQWKKCIETSITQLSDFKACNVIEVRYEDLMKNSEALQKVCMFLNINDISSVIEYYEKSVIRNNINKWKENLTDQQLAMINKEIETLNKQLGYIN